MDASERGGAGEEDDAPGSWRNSGPTHASLALPGPNLFDDSLDDYLAWLSGHDWEQAGGEPGQILVWIQRSLDPRSITVRGPDGDTTALPVRIDRVCRRCKAVMSLQGPPVDGRTFLFSCDEILAETVLGT